MVDVPSDKTDEAIARAFADLERYFQSRPLDTDHAIIRWDIATGTGTQTYQMVLEEGQWAVSPGIPPTARVMVGLSLADFVRLADGEFDGMEALLSGSLRLSGDFLLAEQLWGRR
jgi:putative sterol carrier protein